MMQSTHDVHFGAAIVHRFLASVQDLLVAHGVTLGITQVRPEGAKPTSVYANVGGVKMRVDVVVTEVAIDSLSHVVGQFANFMQRYFGRVQEQAVLHVKPSTLLHFLTDVFQFVLDDRTNHDICNKRRGRTEDLFPKGIDGTDHQKQNANDGIELKKSKLDFG